MTLVLNEVESLLSCIVTAGPLPITLLVFPYDDQQQTFEPTGPVLQCIQEHGKKIVDVKLVYLQGCKALHGSSDYNVEFMRQCEVKERVATYFKRITQEAKTATPVEMAAKFSLGRKDAMLQFPATVTMDVMHIVHLLYKVAVFVAYIRMPMLIGAPGSFLGVDCLL